VPPEAQNEEKGLDKNRETSFFRDFKASFLTWTGPFVKIIMNNFYFSNRAHISGYNIASRIKILI